MKILTLTQPWATLVAIGAKRIETRSWSTRYRGPLAIHAGAGIGPVGGKTGLVELMGEPMFQQALVPGARGGAYWEDIEEAAWNLPRGVIVAVCDLVSCVGTADLQMGRAVTWVGPDGKPYHYQLTDQERAFGDYSDGRYAWLLDNVRPLREPLPYRGAQGLRTLDSKTVRNILLHT